MLKKITIIFCFLLMLFAFLKPNEPVFINEGEYIVYLDDGCSLCGNVLVLNGEKNSVYRKLSGVKGECLKAKNKECIDYELTRLGAKLVFVERGDNFLTSYYYTDKISAYKTINGQKINLQTAVYQDNYIIATPMIYGGF